MRWMDWVPLGGRELDTGTWPGPSDDIGTWLHVGQHPAWRAHIRYGWYPDLGLWWVQCTDRPSGKWTFARQQDAEQAVDELLRMHEPNERIA